MSDTLAPFRDLGLELGRPGSSGNASCDCPFCGKEGHFFVNEWTGQFDCKVCGVYGNIVKFLGMIAEMYNEETKPEDWDALSSDRSCSKNVRGGKLVVPGLPPEAFQEHGMGCVGDEWFLPVKGEKGTVRDIRRWKPGEGFKSTTGCEVQLFGIDQLVKAPKGSTVWICEGEWDAMTLRWLLNQTMRHMDIVVGVPGAGTFKKDWIQYFKGMKVHLCYDFDKPGYHGAKKAFNLLTGVASSLDFVWWSEKRPPGWDLRDQVLAYRATNAEPEEIVGQLLRMFRRTHQADIARPSSGEEKPEGVPLPSGPPPTFGQLLEVFQKWVKIDRDFQDMLAVALATCLGIDIPGEPMWFYFVGPPGSGKTLVLLAMQRHDRVLFKSSLTPASLVSGFNTNTDPSLLPQMDGKTAIFKDGTELLALHPEARREVYSILRGAFDGQLSRSYGNGQVRDYKLHFNLIIGVTNTIHGENQSAMGDRFLKMELADQDQESQETKILRAVSNIAKEEAIDAEIAEACRHFLSRGLNPEALPPCPEWVIKRIVSLAQLVSFLRAQVERESYGDRDLKYKPVPEVGTRIAKQLTKLAYSLAVVFQKEEVDKEVYRIVEKVAFDTMIHFHVAIVRTIMKLNNEGMTRDEIARAARMPTSTVIRRLQDLEQLGVVDKFKPAGAGPTVVLWKLTKRVAALWDACTGSNGVAAVKPAQGSSIRLVRPVGRPASRKTTTGD